MPIKPDHTSHSVLDFLKWQRDGTLNLRPPFQRNAVWRPALKSSLIDSLLRGYPVPALFIQDRSDTVSFERKLVVVDGQQRLRTVLAYVDISCLPDADDRDRFKLLAMHDESRPNATFNDLSEADRKQILDARFTVYVVDSGVSNAELLEIFRRMNTYGAKLNAQELRNAQFSGLFKELAYSLASEFFDYWVGWGTLNTQQVAEMRDAEFTSELMLLALRGVDATTSSRLTDAYTEFEEEFPRSGACAKRVKAIMKLLNSIYRDREPVRRLTSRMWVYSFFDAIQRVRYGGPLEAASSKKKTLTPESIQAAAHKLNVAIENDDLPETVARATRGAANDKQSREARATYLMRRLSASS